MLEYLPWAKMTCEKSLKKYMSGIFSILDIELGGECNYHCMYCDSPDRKKKCNISIAGLEQLMLNGRFDWVYVCGLGEPTFNGNYNRLLKILALCKRYSLRCSVFTNLSILTPELIKFVQEGVLNLSFKYDSQDSGTARTLYGPVNLKKQFDNFKKIKQIVCFENGVTNLTASIVPTRLNKNHIASIVEVCLEAHIFPLIGELEISGKGEVNYNNLYLNREELLNIREEVERIWGEKYIIPICPAVISGIHFSYDSYITVDEYSGLSCHWFWLEEPKTNKLMLFEDNTSIDNISKSILKYRDSKLFKIEEFLTRDSEIGLGFGGCGGGAHEIFTSYLEHHRRGVL
jgi:MoaA/NifB/PqqE/SkfB family radical SAM enzyme